MYGPVQLRMELHSERAAQYEGVSGVAASCDFGGSGWARPFVVMPLKPRTFGHQTPIIAFDGVTTEGDHLARGQDEFHGGADVEGDTLICEQVRTRAGYPRGAVGTAAPGRCARRLICGHVFSAGASASS